MNVSRGDNSQKSIKAHSNEGNETEDLSVAPQIQAEASTAFTYLKVNKRT